MNTSTLPRTLRLQRTPWRSLADSLLAGARDLLSRWLERRAQRRAVELAWAAERELRALDPRTLADIGAPQGLIGQRRWQDEQRQWELDRTLRSRGW